jgi:hypothetical protein
MSWHTAPTLTLSMLAMFSAQPRLAERPLADIAVIGIPRSVKKEMYKGVRDHQPGRLTFTFASAYFLASCGLERLGQTGVPGN